MKTKAPRDALFVDTYAELARHIQASKRGHLSLVILIGEPGFSKSRMVRDALPDACWLEGNATAFGMYRKLWYERNQPVVIDDVDSLYADQKCVRLLKCLCQTEPRKRVAWQTDSSTLRREDIPQEFTTQSRVVIIANEWKTLNRNVAAIEDRGHVICFEPTPLEVHLQTAKWFTNQEVFDFVGEHLHLITRPSMRHYVLAFEKKNAGLDWRGALLRRWVSKGTLIVAELLADESFEDEHSRVEAFRKRTGQGQSSYYYHKKKLYPVVAPPHITLAKAGPQVKNRIANHESNWKAGKSP